MNPTKKYTQDASKTEVMGKRPWIKLWVDPWLDGTTRYQLTDAQTAFWVDLMAMAGRSRYPGIICAGRDGEQWVGYPIARYQALRPSVDVEATLTLFAQTGKIAIEVTHDQPMKLLKLEILNWPKYQSDLHAQAARVRKFREKKKRNAACNAPSHTNVTECNAIEEEGEVEREVEREVEGEVATAAAATSSPTGEDPWTAIGEYERFGSDDFCLAWERAYRERDKDKPLYVTMERFIRSFGKENIPPPFFEAKKRIQKLEREELKRKEPAKPSEDQFLPEMPFKKRGEGSCQNNP